MSEDRTLSDFTRTDPQSATTEENLVDTGFLTMPQDWEATSVREAANDGSGLVDGDWIESKDMDDSGSIQLVQLAHVGEGQFKGEPNRFITSQFASDENCTILSEGDLLISRMQKPILRSCLLPVFNRECVMAVDIARLKHTSDWNRQFLKYIFNSRPIWKQGLAWASGTTRKRISRKNIEKIRLPKPDLMEQRKIASVLYTVDQAIQKTETIVEQTEQVRKGVVQNLLTNGIGHSGHEATRVGPKQVELPTEWATKTISNISDIKNGNRIIKGHDYSNSPTKYPFIRISDMEDGSVSTDNIRYLNEETANQMNRGIIHSNDVYITVTGRIGDAGTVPEELDGARFTDNAAKLYNLDGVTGEYLSLYLRSKFGQDEVHRFSVGSTQPKLSMYRVEKMEVIVPPVAEQERIVEIVSSIEKDLDAEYKIAAKLKRLKRGLMQDLLSGEVRTTDADIEIPDEVLAHG